MFDKLKNKVTSITNKVSEKVNTIKEENERYQQLLKSTTTFQNLFPIPNINIEASEHKVITITNECPDINKDKAKIIAGLIPIQETFISINYAKEIKTNQEYYIIATNKYLWIITTTHFGAYPYTNLNCQIIKNNLMSKIILLNNILLEINGNDTKINTLITLLTNPSNREIIIRERTNYLCGLIPTYQKINTIYSGISIDNNNNIIFHTKTQNYKCIPSDIAYYEILLDNTIIFSSKNSTANKITNFQNSCYQISIRITTKDNQIITLPILEPNTFNTKYQRTDTIFQTNLTFAQELIDKLKEIIPQYY